MDVQLDAHHPQDLRTAVTDDLQGAQVLHQAPLLHQSNVLHPSQVIQHHTGLPLQAQLDQQDLG